MTDLRTLLTRAGEVLGPFAGISRWADHCSEEDRSLGLRDFMLYLESSAFGSGYRLDADDIRRARALHAEITAALAEWQEDYDTLLVGSDTIRCDHCDNVIARSWPFCPWCYDDRNAPDNGWNAAIEAAAQIALDHGDLLEIHGPRIAEEIRKLRKPAPDDGWRDIASAPSERNET